MIYIRRDDNKTIMVLLIVCVMLMVGLYILKDYRSKWNIYCQEPINVMRSNNIQASHAYTERISEKTNSLETLICVKADDSGDLWGNSMQPTFFEGNTLLTKEYNENVTLHTGDLIRYFRFDNNYPNCTAIKDANANNSLGGAWINNSMAVVHRITAIYDDRIVTQGDNLNSMETINRCQVVDVAIGIIFT